MCTLRRILYRLSQVSFYTKLYSFRSKNIPFRSLFYTIINFISSLCIELLHKKDSNSIQVSDCNQKIGDIRKASDRVGKILKPNHYEN